MLAGLLCRRGGWQARPVLHLIWAYIQRFQQLCQRMLRVTAICRHIGPQITSTAVKARQHHMPIGKLATTAIKSRVAFILPVDPATTIKLSGWFCCHCPACQRMKLLRRSTASITPSSAKMAGQRSIKMVNNARISCQCAEKSSGNKSRNASADASAL